MLVSEDSLSKIAGRIEERSSDIKAYPGRRSSRESLVALIIPPGVKEAFPEETQDVETFRARLQDPEFRNTRFLLCPRCCAAAVEAPQSTKLGSSPTKPAKAVATGAAGGSGAVRQKGVEQEESLLEWDGHLVDVKPGEEGSDSEDE